MKIKQEDGTELEVFTTEEVNAKIAEKDAELAKFAEKDLNFSNLRSQKEALEKQLEEAKNAKKPEDLKAEIMGELKEREISAEIKKLAAGDAELEKKIKFNFDRLKDDPSQEGFSSRLSDAFKLSVPTGGSPIGRAVSSAGGPLDFSNRKASVSDDLLNSDVARAMGITKEAIEGLGKK